MILLLLLACQSTSGDFGSLFKSVPAAPAAGNIGTDPVDAPVNSEFAAMRDQAERSGWGDEAEAEAELEVVAEEIEVATPTVMDVAMGETNTTVSTSAPPPRGLAGQPAWGVRLLQTIPAAQPPRAAIGLPDGTEVVVSPGSMLPEVGMVVVAVGPNMAQLARITPAGDHAKIDTVTLYPQYSNGSGSVLGN